MKLKTLLGAAIVAGSFASCSVEDNAEIPAKEAYARDFIKQFGVIDKNQDWSVVEHKNVTVDLAEPAHVKIYAKQSGEYRVAADYKDVTKKTIVFDGVEGDNTPFLLSINGKMLSVSNGETVTLKGGVNSPLRTSAIPDGNTDVKQGSFTTYTLEDRDEVLKTLSEDGVKHEVITTESDYITTLEGSDTYTFVPLYWNSKNTHTAGLYYYDKSAEGKLEMVRIPIYKDHGGDDLQFKVDDKWTKVVDGTDDCWDYGDLGKVEFSAPFSFKAKKYNVKFGKNNGHVCGIYVEVNGEYYYSQAELNPDKKPHIGYKTVRKTDGGQYNYIAFDDPDGDGDFNDLVLYTEEDLTPATKSDYGWTIACEDLGGTFDYDFNDIVFRVYHTAGNNFVTIVPVAAGGTLPAYLHYVSQNGKKDYEISNEWHEHFGNGYKSDVMINTGMKNETVIWPIRIEGVSDKWSIQEFTQDPEAEDGNFYIEVEHADGKKQSITKPSNGEAPQMLVLPVDWQWPTELTRITNVYPNFGTWGENYTNSSWVNNYDKSKTITVKEDEITSTKSPKTTSKVK